MGAALARVAPFAAFIALLALQPLLESSIDSRWLVLGRALAAAVLMAVFWRTYVELRRAPAAPAREWAIAIGAGFAVFLLWITFSTGWAVFGGDSPGFVPLRADGSLDWPLAIARLAALGLVVPLMEELFWRSFVMRWIDKRDFLCVDPRQVSWAAVGISSALFALEHGQWFAGLLAGLAYGTIYRRTGNLKLSVVSHACTNISLGAWVLATHQWRYW